MANLNETLVTLLSDDATLSALLTGGIHNAEDFSSNGGGSDEIPRKANGVQVNPFAIVRFKSIDPKGPYLIGGELQSIEIYVYDNIGYVTIESAISRMKVLLHNKYIDADDRSLVFLIMGHISGEGNAEEHGNIPFKFIRFMNTQIRS